MLGLILPLGHDGYDCPTPTAPVELLVIHSNGHTKIRVQYCMCRSPAPKQTIQLLQARLFPATLKRIQTVFTFSTLDDFHSLNLQGKITLHDYYETLLRRSDMLQLNPRPVSHP